ncbi:MAG TPA: hypothetical protein VKB78_06835 [Pirellulales bacterium]|nr:hypothetical protein [Pirellulales bacterium]
MIKIVVDELTSEKLTELGNSAELCDASGRLLGYFHPAEDDDYVGYDSPLSEEELARRAHDGGGRTLDEIMADLEKRT